MQSRLAWQLSLSYTWPWSQIWKPKLTTHERERRTSTRQRHSTVHSQTTSRIDHQSIIKRQTSLENSKFSKIKRSHSRIQRTGRIPNHLLLVLWNHRQPTSPFQDEQKWKRQTSRKSNTDKSTDSSVLTERAVRASNAVDETCIRFERLVMFEMGTWAWRTHNDAYNEHIHYLRKDIVKPITMSVQELILRFEDMYLLKLFIQPPSKKCQVAGEANWKRRNEIIDQEDQRNSVFNTLPKTFQKPSRI